MSLNKRLIKKKINSFFYHIKKNRWRFNYKKYMVDIEQEIKIDRPIFLLGVQGGGLTLISRVLRRNHALISVTGNHTYWNGSDEMQNVLSTILPDSLKLINCNAINLYGMGKNWEYANDKFLKYFRLTQKDASTESAKRLKTIIRELLVLYANNPNKKRFTDKSQSYTVKVSFLNALLDGCEPYFILITRNPYALCYRAATRILHHHAMPYEEKLRQAAQHWANSMQLALADGETINNFTTLRFEDFLNNPEIELKKLCEFVDVSYSPAMLPQPNDQLPFGGAQDNKWYPLRTDVNDKYLSLLTKKDVEIINERCETLADHFGYSFVP